MEELGHCASAPSIKRTDLPKLDVDFRAATADAPAPESPTSTFSPLRRENKQLRGELKQLQVSLLDSLRRSDRFISGGQFKGKKNETPPARLVEDVRHLKAELRRAHKSLDDSQRAIQDSKHDLEQEKAISADKDSHIERLSRTVREKSDSLMGLHDKHSHEMKNSEAAREQIETELKSCHVDLRNANILLERETERANQATAEVERLTKESAALAGVETSLKNARSRDGELESLQVQFEALKEVNEALRCQSLDAEERNRCLSADNGEKDRRITEMQTQIVWLTAENEKLKQDAGTKDENHRKENERHKAERLKLDDECNALRKELESWKARCAEAKEAEEALRQQVLEEAAQRATLEAELEARRATIEAMQAELEAQRAKIKALQDEIAANAERATQDHLAWAQERDNLRRQVDDSVTEARLAREELRALQESIGQKGALNDAEHTAALAQLEKTRAQQERNKQVAMRTINMWMDDPGSRSLANTFSAWRMQVYSAKGEKLNRELQDADKAAKRLSATVTDRENDAKRSGADRDNAIAERNKALADLQRVTAELQKMKADVKSLKQDVANMKKDAQSAANERAREEAQHRKTVESLDKSVEELKKTLESTAEDSAINRQKYQETQHKLDKALLELNAAKRDSQQLQAKVSSVKDEMTRHADKLKTERREMLASQLQKQLKLQILAPRVSVSVGGEVTDAESAPSPSAIRRVMMDQVLPKFAQANLAGERDEKDQDVQSIMSDMVKAIESKLANIFGRTCLRTE